MQMPRVALSARLAIPIRASGLTRAGGWRLIWRLRCAGNIRIDGTGRIVSRFAGPLARASLESEILPHLDLELPEASQ